MTLRSIAWDAIHWENRAAMNGAEKDWKRRRVLGEDMSLILHMEVRHPVEMASRKVDMWAGVVEGDQSQNYKFGCHWLKLEFQTVWLDEITWGETRHQSVASQPVSQEISVQGTGRPQAAWQLRIPGNSGKKWDFHQSVLCAHFPALSLASVWVCICVQRVPAHLYTVDTGLCTPEWAYQQQILWS